MGSDWNWNGPEVCSIFDSRIALIANLLKRFQQRHDWFWQEAHRLGENRREGLPHGFPSNPFLLMHQQVRADLDDWCNYGP